MDWKQNLQYRYQTANIVEKIIALNVAFFVVFGILLEVVAALFAFSPELITEWLVFPKEPFEFLMKPWTIFTYALMHTGVFHILFNMLILYFSGRFFVDFFSKKMFLNYYFMGGIAGALIYMLSYNLFPAFQGTGNSHLIGASAAVMAVFIGIATKAPNITFRLMLIGNVKLWQIAVFFVVLDLIRIPLGNAGGHLAHLGGAALGYFYTKQLDKGNDIGSGFQVFLDWVLQLFKTDKQKSNMKTVHKNKKNFSSTKKKSSTSKDDKQKKIDQILDKISKSGYDSLTKEEKDFLFNAGRDM
ncbi:MAG: rhomboid family intramembrane serine protease [Bacteroidota bacterium]